MKDIEITISKETRFVDLNKTVIGNESENLQGNLIFKFSDEFVDGVGRLDYKTGRDAYFVMLEKVGESYVYPIKDIFTHKGSVDMQLVITEVAEDEEIPVFKSNVFYLYCNDSINATNGDIPRPIEDWLVIANEKLAEFETMDIDIETEDDTKTVVITRKDGSQKRATVTGGSGVSDYNDLTNKPKINDMTLVGNLSLNELGIQTKLTAGTGIEINNNVISATGGIASWGNITGDIDSQTDLKNKLDSKQNTLISGSNIKTINGYSVLGSGNIEIQGGGSGNFEELTNRPSYNGTVMSGSTNIPEVPTKTSDLTNDSDFADKDFVNSSIASATANFRGTFQSVAELQAYSGPKTVNDYAFVIIYDPVITTQVKQYDRYKYNGTAWVFEYTLNNSSFTAAQWSAINSGITDSKVTKYEGYETTISGKQNTLVSGTNIKTINNNSILGSGNLTVVGEQGPQGEKGETGEKGEKGDTGEKGEKGDTVVSLTVGTTTTGEPGTNASVTNVGTATEAILNFTIPRGPQGIQGIQGIQGLKGDTGEKGEKGDTLVSMTIGTTTTGNPGTNATVTNSGTATEPVLNFTIPRGNTGATGPQGIQGLRGDTGPQGPKGDTVVSVQVGTTTTGASGTDASVTNSGTDTEAVLNFTIPRGLPGQDGRDGQDGLDGAIQYTAGTGIEITSDNVINNTQTSAEWGNITGDIEDQTDLQTALSGKQDTITNVVDGVSNLYHIWNGTEAQYNALATKDTNTIYLIHE